LQQFFEIFLEAGKLPFYGNTIVTSFGAWEKKLRLLKQPKKIA